MPLHQARPTRPNSLADAWITAAAQRQGPVLLHKDPATSALDQLPQEWLG